jgi:hypothetical protein
VSCSVRQTVGRVLCQHVSESPLVEDQHPVQALTTMVLTHRPAQALPWAHAAAAQRLDADIGEHASKLAVNLVSRDRGPATGTRQP